MAFGKISQKWKKVPNENNKQRTLFPLFSPLSLSLFPAYLEHTGWENATLSTQRNTSLLTSTHEQINRRREKTPTTQSKCEAKIYTVFWLSHSCKHIKEWTRWKCFRDEKSWGVCAEQGLVHIISLKIYGHNFFREPTKKFKKNNKRSTKNGTATKTNF